MGSDPTAIVEGIEAAEQAFEYIGTVSFEEGIDQATDWKTQLTKACRYLEACRSLRANDGFNGAVVELCFGAIERTLEAYLLWDTADDLTDFMDHESVYDRVVQRGLFEAETGVALQALYSTNRTEHYYGGVVPTEQKETAMFELATSIHQYSTEQIREGGVCTC